MDVKELHRKWLHGKTALERVSYHRRMVKAQERHVKKAIGIMLDALPPAQALGVMAQVCEERMMKTPDMEAPRWAHAADVLRIAAEELTP